jgi:hypothetical protein
MESELAYYNHDTKKALERAQLAASSLKQTSTDGTPSAKELHVEALFLCAGLLWNDGNAEKAFEYISAAESNLRNARASSGRLRARVLTAFWNVRQSHLLSSTAWCPSWQRLKGLTGAFEDAYASGILSEASKALECLAHAHAILGNASEALTAARSAVLLARQGNNETMALEASISSAVNLLYTNNWERAASFLPSREQTAHVDPTYRYAFLYFDALYALRSKAFSKARAVAFKQLRNCKSPSWIVKTSLVAALAAHALERRREASTLIEATIPNARKLGVAEILRDACNVAATITGESRFKSEVAELTDLITA